MKPKLLIIPENFPTDENPVAGIFMKDQIRALSPAFEIIVFNSNPWYRGVYEQVEGARFFDFHLFTNRLPTLFKLPGYAWWEYQSFQIAKNIPKPDIIYLHGAALRGGWVRKLAKYWDIPYIVTEHTGPWSAISDRSGIFKRAKSAMENAAAVLPVSEHLKSEMIDSGVKVKRWKVFGNPVDTDFFELRRSPLTHSKNILFLGRLDDFKGALRTLKAFHKIAAQIPEYRLTIAGAGQESDAIFSFIADNKLDGRVEFLSHNFSREEMKILFHRSSFLVFPSLFESFGLVAAEAMSTGLPVVITNRTGPVDFTSSGTAVAINPDSVDGIAAGILKIAQNLKDFDANSIREFVKSRFGFESYRENVLELFSSLS